jgi:hypothetical protein
VMRWDGMGWNGMAVLCDYLSVLKPKEFEWPIYLCLLIAVMLLSFVLQSLSIIHSYIQPTILHTYISTGLKAMYHRDLLHRMHSEGHELANHGFHSVLFTDLSFEDIASNVLRTSGIISNVTNSQVKYFRPPKGNLRYCTWWRWRSVSLLVMMKYCLYMHDALWLWS